MCLVTQSRPSLCNPMDLDCSLPGSSVRGILQARTLGWVAMPFSRALPNPGMEPRSPALRVDSLPAESPGKSRNTGVGSLSLLQGISLTQESNQGLLHCRQTLYQLSYQESSLSEIIFLLCKRKTKLYITAFCRDCVPKAVD